MTKYMMKSQNVFSTCVEVFLAPNLILYDVPQFSPRVWRCFSPKYIGQKSGKVFSTCVEVFL